MPLKKKTLLITGATGSFVKFRVLVANNSPEIC